MERLDKIVANQFCVGRTEARRLIRIGKVEVDGKVIKNFSQHVNPQTSEIIVDSQKMEYQEHIYLMMNKPKGVLSATNDKNSKTVIDLIPDKYRRKGLAPVGRLDKDTTGLLLITDDGEFAHKVISPKSEIIKKYLVEVDSAITNEMCEIFKKGVILADGTSCLPAELKIINNKPAFTCEISIMEGKYHQIKRMLGTVGLGVNQLERLSIGGLMLDENLELGECKILSKNELNAVFV